MSPSLKGRAIRILRNSCDGACLFVFECLVESYENELRDLRAELEQTKKDAIRYFYDLKEHHSTYESIASTSQESDGDPN